ncbi:MAG: UDP-2,3-diacylglucosamine diphosphatase LpxI [Hyphomicrobium sp.]|nr:UDP-2,3-diacylglucosamine diphosphatase LpxI [Hyphomicrobium sp.]
MNGPLKLDHPLRVGIIAGGGSLPLEIARSVVARGGFVHVLMIEGQASGALRSFSHTDASWAELGKAIKSFKRAGVKDIVMVGRMVRPNWKTAKPDFGVLRSLPAILRIFRSGGDDSILRAVIAMFEGRGLKVRGVGEVAPELLVSDGAMTDISASADDEADIATGFQLIAALGRHDIGQAAVVSKGRIEAIEGAEGTDRMIARVGRQRRDAKGDPLIRSRGVVVKRPKPGQDLRVDLPTIGPETVQQATDARLAGIAAMSGHVLAASRFELINAAEREGLFVVGLPDHSAPPLDQLLSTKLTDSAPLVFGKIDLSSALKSDVRRGVAIMSTLAQFAVGTAVVIRNRRVLAIGAHEKALDVITRAAEIFRPARRRAGVAFIGHRTPVDEALIEAIADAGLEGLIVMFGREDRPQHKGSIVARADELGLFIAGAPVAALEPA